MASRISNECSAIQRGVGDKVGNVLQALFGGVFSFVVAFYIGWEMTLFLFAVMPVILILGATIFRVFKQGLVEQMRSYA